MTEISNNIQNTPVQAQHSTDYNTDAHTSTNMKVERPKITAYQGPASMPQHNVYSDQKASLKIRQINDDIYEGSKGFVPKKISKKSNIDKLEKSQEIKNEFDSKLYFKIFGGLTLTAIIIAGLRKIRRK